VIPSFITEIKEDAFLNCSSSIYFFDFENRITSLPPNLFASTFVTSILFPETLKLAPNFLNNVPSLSSIEFTGSFTTLPDNSFQNLPRLSKFIINNIFLLKEGTFDVTETSIQSIGKGVFLNSSIKKVTFPGSFREYPSCFAAGPSLEVIQMVYPIDHFHLFFSICPNLVQISIASKLLYTNGILDTTAVSPNFTFLEVEDNYSLSDGKYFLLPCTTLITNLARRGQTFLFSKNDGINEAIIRDDLPDPFQIPVEVRSIPLINTITFHDHVIFRDGKFEFSFVSILRFENNAFQYMKIRKIDLPSTCTNIVPYMFADYSELETFVIPFEFEIIPKSFFQNSPKIHHIYINVEELFHQNILDFNSFNITEIGDFAFQNVSHVTHIIFDDRNLVIGSGAFSSLTLTRSIEFINFPKIFNCSSNAFPRNTISSVIFPPGIFKFMVPDWDWNTMFNSDSETLDTSKFQYDPSPTLSNVHDNFALSNNASYLIKCLIASGDVNVPDSVSLVVANSFSSCYEVDVTFEMRTNFSVFNKMHLKIHK
jgi:hypothetical protein